VNAPALPAQRGREGPLWINELLKKSGIDIARRTVAKYREQLGILSSSKRKQVF
jgi:DNA-directed RNA polymerase specialized sigma54-like protein